MAFHLLPGPLKLLGIVADCTWFEDHQKAVINGATVTLLWFNLSK